VLKNTTARPWSGYLVVITGVLLIIGACTGRIHAADRAHARAHVQEPDTVVEDACYLEVWWQIDVTFDNATCTPQHYFETVCNSDEAVAIKRQKEIEAGGFEQAGLRVPPAALRGFVRRVVSR
jgi:hypothetical protein